MTCTRNKDSSERIIGRLEVVMRGRRKREERGRGKVEQSPVRLPTTVLELQSIPKVDPISIDDRPRLTSSCSRFVEREKESGEEDKEEERG